MSKLHQDIDAFAKVENHDGESVFNDSDEEERYQAFKSRLLRDVVATGEFLEQGWYGDFQTKSKDMELKDRKP